MVVIGASVEPTQQAQGETMRRGMSKKAEVALRQSIKHWERMRKNVDCGEEPYADHCPLCQLFLKTEQNKSEVFCSGCPIFKRTGSNNCDGTPWFEAASAWQESWDDDKMWIACATRMIRFLRSLLPKEGSHATGE